jgi:hypothetical protein
VRIRLARLLRSLQQLLQYPGDWQTQFGESDRPRPTRPQFVSKSTTRSEKDLLANRERTRSAGRSCGTRTRESLPTPSRARSVDRTGNASGEVQRGQEKVGSVVPRTSVVPVPRDADGRRARSRSPISRAALDESRQSLDESFTFSLFSARSGTAGRSFAQQSPHSQHVDLSIFKRTGSDRSRNERERGRERGKENSRQSAPSLRGLPSWR